MSPTKKIANLKPPADKAVTQYSDTYFDALLVVSFGGPEGEDDVLPFLRNVTRGRNVPPERLEEVANHYSIFNGVSPINSQNRSLIDELRTSLNNCGVELPIYFGNRNWHPLLTDTLNEMTNAGVKRALGLFTTAYSSYSSCRQYRENIYQAQVACGENSPEVLKIRPFYNHPLFIKANSSRLEAVLEKLSANRQTTRVIFTAHSIPESMAKNCHYQKQLEETARLTAEQVGFEQFELAYQSRSGPPHIPWIGPDICDRIQDLKKTSVTDIVLSPIGFLSDHIEVLFDLDIEAFETAQEVGIALHRAESVGTHPMFIEALTHLVQERLTTDTSTLTAHPQNKNQKYCGPHCCLPGTGAVSPWEEN